MAVVPMKKLTVVGMKSEKDALLAAFTGLGCTHISQSEPHELMQGGNSSDLQQAAVSAAVAVEKAMSFIEEASAFVCENGLDDRKKPFKVKGARFDVPFEEFASITGGDRQITGIVRQVEEYSEEISRSKADYQANKKLISGLLPYRRMDIKFSEVKDTGSVAMILGRCPNLQLKMLYEVEEKFPYAEFEWIDTVTAEERNEKALFVCCFIEEKAAVLSELARFNFAQCPYDFDKTADMLIEELYGENKALNKRIDELYIKTAELGEFIPKLKVLCDYYGVDAEKAKSSDDIMYTAETFFLTAWFPAEDEERVRKTVEKTMSAVIVQIDEPNREKDLPPTKIKSNKFFTPFNFVTEMMSVTNYWERDPNGLVAFWFTMIFGIMLGDAGYGLILIILGFLGPKLLKAEGGMKQLMHILGYGGISTVFWGIMFGGFFSIDSFANNPILLSPTDDAMLMMGMSLLVGILHMSSAYVANAFAAFREKRILDGILDSLVWIVFFVGLAIALCPMFITIEGLNTDIGLYLLIGSLVVVALTAGRKKKGILGKAAGGFGGLYNVIGLFSDVLSYLRLFGLGLATGIVGMVFNLIGTQFMGGLGTVLGVFIIIFGHILNIALNTLGTYIHDMRLQHMEMFGKFFTGEGIKFVPLGSNTQYIRIENKKEE